MLYGQIINNCYQIQKEIGSGGGGVIYLAWHLNLQKYVVLKKMKYSNREFLNKRAEADILKSLHHSYLPQVYDFIEIQDQIFTVIEYIEGYDLNYYVNHGYQFSEEQLLFWLNQLCEVLIYLHSRNPSIIHSDIKPSNIMITTEGNVCLIDFNISIDGKNSKDLVGLSSRYASPEQMKRSQAICNGQNVPQIDERSDIYSLGATFYTLMAGAQSAGYETVVPLQEWNPSYSKELIRIVQHAMEKSVKKRFQSAQDLLDALQHIYRYTDTYRKYRIIQWFVTLVYSVGFVLCLGMILYGYKIHQWNEFQEVYTEYCSWAQERIWSQDDSSQMILRGKSMLENPKYAKFLEKDSIKYSNINCLVADAYFTQESYLLAQQYYQSALKADVSDSSLYCSLAIAQIRNGDLYTAEVTLAQANNHQAEDTYVKLVKAEWAQAKGKKQEAIQLYNDLIEKAQIQEVVYRAALECMQIYEGESQLDEEILILNQAKEKVEKHFLYDINQKLGWVYQTRGQSKETKSNSDAVWDYKQAILCYKQAVQSEFAGFTDQYNLAILYEKLQQYDLAKEQLAQLCTNYPKDYRVYMRLAYIELECIQEKAEKNYSKLSQYYKKALELYHGVLVSGDYDVVMEQLIEMIGQLETQHQISIGGK